MPSRSILRAGGLRHKRDDRHNGLREDCALAGPGDVGQRAEPERADAGSAMAGKRRGSAVLSQARIGVAGNMNPPSPGSRRCNLSMVFDGSVVATRRSYARHRRDRRDIPHRSAMADMGQTPLRSPRSSRGAFSIVDAVQAAPANPANDRTEARSILSSFPSEPFPSMKPHSKDGGSRRPIRQRTMADEQFFRLDLSKSSSPRSA